MTNTHNIASLCRGILDNEGESAMDVMHGHGERIEWAVVVILTAIAVILWTIDLIAFARIMGR